MHPNSSLINNFKGKMLFLNLQLKLYFFILKKKNLNPNEFRIKFEYKTLQGCDFLLFIGVNNINEDPNKKNTTEI